MTSAAQISYPAQGEEPDESPEEEREDEAQPVPDAPDCAERGTCEDGAAFEATESYEDERAGDGFDYVQNPSSIPPDRPYDISPEEFCGDPYEQEGHIRTRQELGRRGEEAAVRYLVSKDYQIIKRNWFCRFGEADIIARDPEGSLCFIEVKTRQSVEAGLPEEAITVEKQRRYERIALCYMMVTDDWDDNDSIRFDAIGICVNGPHRAMLRHHKGCFNVWG